MMHVLGAAGSNHPQPYATALLIHPRILVDAGHVMPALGEQSVAVEHVLLTHAHFDHIADLPFLIETHFEQRRHPLKVYGLKATLQALQQHLFNDVIWPRFHTIVHPQSQTPMLEFVELQLEHPFELEGMRITPIAAEHTVPACGFLLEKNGVASLISGDTAPNPQLIERIHQDKRIQTLVIETSFPSRLQALADQSKHLTPKSLNRLMAPLTRDLTLCLYHLKPAYESEIREELAHLPALQHARVLNAGDQVALFGESEETPVPAGSPHSDQARLESLLTIAQALSAETHLDKLLEMILQQAMHFADADAGTLYQLSANRQELDFKVVKNNTLNLHTGGSHAPTSWDSLPLYLPNGEPNTQMVAVHCALSKQVINIANVYEVSDFDFSGTRRFDQHTGYQSRSMLVIPLLDRQQQLLGVLQLINKQDNQGHNLPFSAYDQKSTLALASQAAISLNNALLIQQLETLFEAVLATISKALDEKCSFSGAHVRQVAELAELIAKGIHQDQSVYRDVHYTPEQLHTIKVAALLHDVGKITTPEFIMQKATKLERVYDRIHTLEERIEILKRDAELQALHQALPDWCMDNRTEERIQQLEETLTFLKQVNLGNEFLSDDALTRLQEISRITYQKQGQSCPLLDEEERHNLSIRAGTLNPEERAKIMDHARVSLDILQSLPFPPKYHRIVDIAANHHEKLDGSGYPRGLTGDQLTLEDRILILADLYEALSSQDRPYKEPHPLSKITQILSSMANEGLIDKQLVKFFFESGLYKAFNKRLKPSQIDDFELTLH
jgi:HD-GYP domain-containing protein (c-di-GMP phosphodiesterase class II)/ribonuclease BN (tRNA processing enzyme)